MQPEEINTDIPEETVAEDAHEEAAPAETDQEETIQESDPDQESIQETEQEETSSEETTQEMTASEKDTIQDREEIPETSLEEALTEYSSPASDLEYGVFEQILVEQQTTNVLLLRITNQNDLFLGIGVALIICCIAYSILERFTKF